MSDNFVLFCKSYKNDILRLKKLLESIVSFNKDKIPFFLSVPKEDIKIFESYINFSDINKQIPFYLVTDEDIAKSSNSNGLIYYYEFPGYLHQQVIKAEAWKLMGCENYLCLDSDCYFTDTFDKTRFFHNDGTPYTLMHEPFDLLNLATKLKKANIVENYIKDCNVMKEEFGRTGPNYDFGPLPTIWNKKVWESLYHSHLLPKNENIWLAIKRIPSEIRWYGESLLKFNAIPIHPITPIFNVYHYAWQYKYLKKYPSKQYYLGEVLQSNWDTNHISEFQNKSVLSIYWKKLKNLF